MSLPPELAPLREALRRRMEIIADTAWRDRDPPAQLQALQDISESIFQRHAALARKLPPRLHHFMESQSYTKALALLDELAAG